MGDDTVFIGLEDGIAIYTSRKNISGIDRAMQRDHMRREAQGNAQRALYEYHKRKREQEGVK